MTMNLTPTEANKLEDEANPETSLLAFTKQHSLEYTGNNCKTQDAVMAESTGGGGSTGTALNPPEMEVLTPGISEKASSSQIPHAPNGEAKVVPSHCMLRNVCFVNKWKAPEFEWCVERDPGGRRLFTCKIIVEVPVGEAASTTFLECFSNPMSKKKTALEHAASGVVWYLKQLGYFAPKETAKVKRRKYNHKKPRTEGVFNATSQ